MTRDETVALFLECEAKRPKRAPRRWPKEKTNATRKTRGHEAAKAHWNAWAEPCSPNARPWKPMAAGPLKRLNGMRRARANFNFCLFLNAGAVRRERGRSQSA